MSAAQHDEDHALRSDLDLGDERERQIVELLRVDYDATLRALTGFVGAGAQLRAVGIAAWGIIVGLGAREQSTLLAVLALAIVLLFAYADGYHAALYRRALSRAIYLEGLFDAYLERLGIAAEDPEAVLRTRARLETHRFGMHRTLRPLRAKDVFAARPRAIFWVIYPAIAAISLVFILVSTT